MKLRLLGAVCAFVSALGLFESANAALVDNGGGLIYDTVLDITWAQPDARRSFTDAEDWAARLTLGGVSGWRLPYISVAAGAGPFTGSPVDCSTATEVACRDNELGYMFYHNLSGTFGQYVGHSGDPDLALFVPIEDISWSGTEFDSNSAWLFVFGDGTSDLGFNIFPGVSWAVHAGDVRPVPVPAAVWLFASGLLGLVAIARSKAA